MVHVHVGGGHCCVIRKCNDGVGVVFVNTLMGEHGVQEGTKHTPLRGPSVEDQLIRRVVAPASSSLPGTR